ncbi:hypothetical protein HGRIS_013953 [Hohenbuehelia grisea]|uniref:Uncharacterized protein n=1 Tax=Hohenbuehelia grisea TaxID=104357 RepID=A0ABR3JTJ9_9AGAR
MFGTLPSGGEFLLSRAGSERTAAHRAVASNSRTHTISLGRRFKIRAPNSLYKPTYILTAIFSLLLRTIRAVKEKDMGHIGSFRLRCTSDQLAAGQALYDLIVDSEGSPDPKELFSLFHQACRTFLRPELLSDAADACVTEQLVQTATSE